MVYVIQVCWQLARSQAVSKLIWKSWSCSQAVSKPVWHIPLLCVQWKTHDDGQRNRPKHIEFYSKNKFEKLVHLVGFVIRMTAKVQDIVWRHFWSDIRSSCCRWFITLPWGGKQRLRSCSWYFRVQNTNIWKKIVKQVDIQYVHISTSGNLFRFFQHLLNKNKRIQWFISGLPLSKFRKFSYFTLYLLRNLNVRDTRKTPTCLAFVNITSSLTNNSVTNAKYGHR